MQTYGKNEMHTDGNKQNIDRHRRRREKQEI
jgi:hypothetical protein